MKKIFYLLILLNLSSLGAFAQIEFYENDTTWHAINQQTSKEVLDKYLESIKAKDIVFSEELPQQYYKIQDKKGKWKLWQFGEAINEAAYDEIQFPSQAISYITIAKNKGKYGLFLLNSWNEWPTEFLYYTIVFANQDAIANQIKENEKSLKKSLEESLEIDQKRLPNLLILAKKKGLWGRIDLSEEMQPLIAEAFIYENPENVPTTNWDMIYQLPYLQALYEKKNIDLAQPFPQEVVYVLARDRKNKKWGLFGGEGEFEDLIETAYDSIIGHKYPVVYEVWNERKVGYYNEEFQLVAEPKFENFQYVHLDYTYGCALYSNGKWQLYDAYESKLLVEGKAKTIEELIELWLNRH